MDLRAYYEAIERLEREIGAAEVVIVSKQTPDGGRAGRFAEVSKTIAAKLVVEGKARLATEEESEEFRQEERLRAERAAVKPTSPGGLQVTVISEQQLDALRNAVRQDGE